jgi:hypothetical protein
MNNFRIWKLVGSSYGWNRMESTLQWVLTCASLKKVKPVSSGLSF